MADVSKPKLVNAGESVQYIPADPKRGRLSERALVLKVHANGSVDLKWKRVGAFSDITLTNVPRSETLKRGHWTPKGGY